MTCGTVGQLTLLSSFALMEAKAGLSILDSYSFLFQAVEPNSLDGRWGELAVQVDWVGGGNRKCRSREG